MANTIIQNIGLGTVPNDGLGDPIRVGGDKINDNIIACYRANKTIISAQTTLALFCSAEHDTTEYFTTEIGTIVQVNDGVSNTLFRQFQNTGSAEADYVEFEGSSSWSGLWETDGIKTYLKTAKTLSLEKTLQTNQAPDQASTNALVTSNSGNLIVLSNTTNDIQTISCKNSDGEDIQGGIFYFLDVKSGQTIINLHASSGDYKPIRMHTNADWTADRDTLLLLTYDIIHSQWKVSGDGVGGGVAIWESTGGFSVLKTAEQIRLSKMHQEGQSTAIATATNVTPPANGNYVNFSNSTTDVERIANIDSDGKSIQGGTKYAFDVKEGTTIKHLVGNSGDNKQIRVDSGQDWTAGKDIPVIAFYDSEDDWWELSGTATGDTIADITNIFAIPVIPSYNISTTAVLSLVNLNLTGCSVTNEGSATVTINGNDIDIGTGSLYGIKIYNASSDIIYEIPMVENNVLINFVYDIVDGDQFLLIGTKTLTTQSDYLQPVINAFEEREFIEGGEKINVCRKNDGTLIDL